MRGLSRVWLTLHVKRIIQYLTLKGYINCGLLTIPKSPGFIPEIETPQKVKLSDFVYCSAIQNNKAMCSKRHCCNCKLNKKAVKKVFHSILKLYKRYIQREQNACLKLLT